MFPKHEIKETKMQKLLNQRKEACIQLQDLMLLSIDRILDYFNDPSADQSHCEIVDND